MSNLRFDLTSDERLRKDALEQAGEDAPHASADDVVSRAQKYYKFLSAGSEPTSR